MNFIKVYATTTKTTLTSLIIKKTDRFFLLKPELIAEITVDRCEYEEIEYYTLTIRGNSFCVTTNMYKEEYKEFMKKFSNFDLE